MELTRTRLYLQSEARDPLIFVAFTEVGTGELETNKLVIQ